MIKWVLSQTGVLVGGMYINCCAMQVMPFDNTHLLTAVLRSLDRLTDQVYLRGRSLGSEAHRESAGDDDDLILRLRSILTPCRSFSIWGALEEEKLFLVETKQIMLFVELFIRGINSLHNICEHFISVLTDTDPRRIAFAVENIDRTFWVLRYSAEDAKRTTSDPVTVEYSNILLACVPQIIYKEESSKPGFNARDFISNFLSILGQSLSRFHDSLQINESFQGNKGTLFIGELKIVVRNLIQSNADLLSASVTDAKDQVELQKLREPPVAMFPGSGEGRDWNPNDRFVWTPGHPP